jgi:Heavy metal binding domain
MEPGTPMLWCPMHPNVRAPAGTCKECGMALVPIPDNTGASYWLDVRADPLAVVPKKPTKLRIGVRDRSTNAVVSRFDRMHERLLHLFVVSNDLTFFDHVHPETATDGWFEVVMTFPKPGAYRLVADLLPTGATPQTLQHTILTAGPTTRAVSPARSIEAEVLEVREGGVRARLIPNNMRVGDDSHVVLELADADTGQPLTDLELYLGAWGHMLLASSDLADIVHSHPLIEETARGGPTITFQTMFARQGWYRVWAQVQRRGRLLTFGFTVRVAASV